MSVAITAATTTDATTARYRDLVLELESSFWVAALFVCFFIVVVLMMRVMGIVVVVVR